MNEFQQEIKIFTEPEAAKILKLSAVTIARMRKAGKLQHRRAGSRIIYTQSDLMEFLETLKRPAVEKATA